MEELLYQAIVVFGIAYAVLHIYLLFKFLDLCKDVREIKEKYLENGGE